MDVVGDIKAEPKLERDELWFQDAIIYQLHVKAFADSNNDGMGDFAGLTENSTTLRISASRLFGYGRSIPRPAVTTVTTFRTTSTSIQISARCRISAVSCRRPDEESCG
jgi:hypothetical protein